MFKEKLAITEIDATIVDAIVVEWHAGNGKDHKTEEERINSLVEVIAPVFPSDIGYDDRLFDMVSVTAARVLKEKFSIESSETHIAAALRGEHLRLATEKEQKELLVGHKITEMHGDVGVCLKSPEDIFLKQVDKDVSLWWHKHGHMTDSNARRILLTQILVAPYLKNDSDHFIQIVSFISPMVVALIKERYGVEEVSVGDLSMMLAICYMQTRRTQENAQARKVEEKEEIDFTATPPGWHGVTWSQEFYAALKLRVIEIVKYRWQVHAFYSYSEEYARWAARCIAGTLISLPNADLLVGVAASMAHQQAKRNYAKIFPVTFDDMIREELKLLQDFAKLSTATAATGGDDAASDERFALPA